jgi:SUKH superfamily protein
MEFTEFDEIVDEARAQEAAMSLPAPLKVVDLSPASSDSVARAEQTLRVRLPDKYRAFMTRYGGGQLNFLDILPIESTGRQRTGMISVNQAEFPEGSFVAVAPVGTGDWWGFRAAQGVCEDAVCFRDHEDGHFEFVADDFLDFVALRGFHPA